MSDENLLEMKENITDVTIFDPPRKKKKKKKVQVRAEVSVDNLTEKTDKLTIYVGAEDASIGFENKNIAQVEFGDFSEDNFDSGDDFVGDEEIGNGLVQSQHPWDGTERDYKYEELLGRVFCMLHENNPELAGDRRRTVIRPPQVLHEGNKKTVFVNFMDICKMMHRQPEQVMTFLLAEMGTSGSIDGQQRLVVKGRFDPKNFEGIVRRYINEYVICNSCKSPDTILSEENHLFFLGCEQCGTVRSVASIKAGYVGRVERRKLGI